MHVSRFLIVLDNYGKEYGECNALATSRNNDFGSSMKMEVDPQIEMEDDTPRQGNMQGSILQVSMKPLSLQSKLSILFGLDF